MCHWSSTIRSREYATTPWGLGEWLKQPGDAVKADEPIVSLEEFAEPAVQPAADVLEAESEEDAIARAIAEEQETDA